MLPSAWFGVHPVGMKRAVMSPQAMNAAMFGMTMPDRNVPNLWTWTRALRRGAACDVAVIVVLRFLAV
jgi:hypothetical protein